MPNYVNYRPPTLWDRILVQRLSRGTHSHPPSYQNARELTPICEGIIYADSQASIKAVINPERQSGQSIIQAILDTVEELRRQNLNISITIVWIPGHEDIPGNELVDVEAKEAAQTPELGTPFRHLLMKSSRNAIIKKIINEEWSNEWIQGETGGYLRAITEQPESESCLTLYNSLTTRKSVALLARLRTGHCSLNGYLTVSGLKTIPNAMW
jgi:hypothetical protein